jgi:hypothetical protein
MSTARDKLIADWRARLDAAEAEPVASSPRRAWLVRVRTRLYRFLLSLYGDGAWRADDQVPPEPAVQEPAVVFDAEALAGKPAKDEGKIRSVLKAVANSQDHRPQSGTLTADEVLANCWFVVATTGSNLSLPRCHDLLERNHIECRTQARGDEMVLEVPAQQRYEAMALLDERRALVRKPPRFGSCQAQLEGQCQVRLVRSRVTTLSALFAWFVSLLACFGLLLTAITLPERLHSPESLHAYYRTILALVFICFASAIWAWWRSRPAVGPREDVSAGS